MFDIKKFKKETVGNQVVFKYDVEDAFVKGAEAEGLTKETLEKYEAYAAKYKKEFMGVTAELGKTTMSKDKKIESITTEVDYTTSKKGSLGGRVDRSKTFHGINGKPDTTKSKITMTETIPYTKVSKKYIGDLEEELTKLLIDE